MSDVIASQTLPAAATLSAAGDTALPSSLRITSNRFGPGVGPRTSTVEPVQRLVYAVPA